MGVGTSGVVVGGWWGDRMAEESHHVLGYAKQINTKTCIETGYMQLYHEILKQIATSVAQYEQRERR